MNGLYYMQGTINSKIHEFVDDKFLCSGKPPKTYIGWIKVSEIGLYQEMCKRCKQKQKLLEVDKWVADSIIHRREEIG